MNSVCCIECMGSIRALSRAMPVLYRLTADHKAVAAHAGLVERIEHADVIVHQLAPVQLSTLSESNTMAHKGQILRV